MAAKTNAALDLMPNRVQRLDPETGRWEKLDPRTGVRINLKADPRRYKRVAVERPTRGRFLLHLALREAKRKRVEMARDAKALRYLAGLDGSAGIERWEKVKGSERTSVAVFADGSRVFFDRKGKPLNHPR